MKILKIVPIFLLSFCAFAQFTHQQEATHKAMIKKQRIFSNQTSLASLRKIQKNQIKHGLMD